MVSKTGWTSVGELQMTRRISPVAVCCSSVSRQVAVARLQLLEQPHVLDGDDGLVGEGLEQLDLLVGEGSGLARAPTAIAPDGHAVAQHRNARATLRKLAVRATAPCP